MVCLTSSMMTANTGTPMIMPTMPKNPPITVMEMMTAIVDDEAELITVYYGKDVAEEDAQALTDELADLYDDCDVEMQMGGQPLYYYLISVE